MFFSRFALLIAFAFAAGCTAWHGNIHGDIVGNSNVRASAQIRKGLHWYAKADLARAQTHFERAVRADDRSGVAHNNLGLILYDQSDFPAAERHFRAAIERMPATAQPINNLGLVLERTERFDQALAMYEHARSMDPENPQFLGNALRTRRKMGEPADCMIPELKELLRIENRPRWRAWAEDTLHYEVPRQFEHLDHDSDSESQFETEDDDLLQFETDELQHPSYHPDLPLEGPMSPSP